MRGLPPSVRTLSNGLSLFRLLSAIPWALLIMSPGWPYKLAAIGLFGLAGITDYLDGKIAHRRGQVTPLGTFLDPLADKVFIIVAFAVISHIEPLFFMFWFLPLIMMREFLITYLRLITLENGGELRTEGFAKLKTFSQVTALLTLMICLLLKDIFASEYSSLAEAAYKFDSTWIFLMTQSLVGITVLLSLLSGVLYILKNRNLFR